MKLYEKGYSIEKARESERVEDLEAVAVNPNKQRVNLTTNPKFGSKSSIELTLTSLGDFVGLDKNKDTPRYSVLEDWFGLTPVKPNQEEVHSLVGSVQTIVHPVYGREKVSEIAKEMERESREKVKTDEVIEEALENRYEIVSGSLEDSSITFFVTDDGGIQLSSYKELSSEEILEKVSENYNYYFVRKITL